MRMRRADGTFPEVPPPMDFRAISRNSDKVSTSIILYTDHDQSIWITLGEISLQERTNKFGGIWALGAYLLNATDFEHDSAHLFKMDLVGVTFTAVEYGQTRFEAFIRGDSEHGFCVGGPDYNPLKHKDTVKCKDCSKGDKHLIVPEGFYVPPVNVELYNIVRGRRIEVVTGIPAGT